MNYFDDITQLIGHTPLLRLGRIAPDGHIFAKCEFLNPVSLKDRPVLQIVEDAKADGRFEPGDTLIEATSGNTGAAAHAALQVARRLGNRVKNLVCIFADTGQRYLSVDGLY